MASPIAQPAIGSLSLRQYATDVPISPGQNALFRNTAGNVLYIAEASHPNFHLLLNDKVKIKGRLARGYRFPTGESVTKVQVFNNDASQALSILFEIGKADIFDNGLNVYTEQITPTVRQENPASFSLVEVECTGVGNSLPLLPQDCDRHHALLFVSAGGEAYYGPDATTDWPTVDGNRIGQTLDNSATRYQACAACYVRGAAGTTAYAFVFGF